MQAPNAIVTAPSALGAALNAIGRAPIVLGRAPIVLGRAPIVLGRLLMYYSKCTRKGSQCMRIRLGREWHEALESMLEGEVLLAVVHLDGDLVLAGHFDDLARVPAHTMWAGTCWMSMQDKHVLGSVGVVHVGVQTCVARAHLPHAHQTRATLFGTRRLVGLALRRALAMAQTVSGGLSLVERVPGREGREGRGDGWW